MTDLLAYAGSFFVLLGGFFCITGGVGLLRFPDFYTRMHAAGVTDTSGAGFVFFGLTLVTLGNWHGLASFLVLVKLAVILFFLWVTGTTACHALAKAAWMSGEEPWTKDGGDPSTS